MNFQAMLNEMNAIMKTAEAEPKGAVLQEIAKKYPDLLKKKAGVAGLLPPAGAAPGIAAKAGGLLSRLASEAGTHKAELAGLGILAVPAVDHLQARVRTGLAGEQGNHAVEKRQFMGETGKALTEIGGLGVLAGPSAVHLLRH